jgi:branched-chain amino acid transport system ATP-binding protein
LFHGKDITGLPSYKICKLGVTRTFQIVQRLKEMTVEENIMTGAFLHTNSAKRAREAAGEILELTGLTAKKDVLGGILTIVDKKRVEIARALATKPELLMIDEMSLGLAPVLVDKVMDSLKVINSIGITVLLMEQKVQEALEYADRGYVLQNGRMVISGTNEEFWRPTL